MRSRISIAGATATVAIGVTALLLILAGEDEPTERRSSPAAALRFSPQSVWSSPVPARAAVDARSGPIVRTLVRSVREQERAGIGPGLSARARAPIYTAGPDVPRVPVKLDTGEFAADLEAAFAEGVPIPDRARPSTGSDGMLIVWQPASDTYWEFFQMQRALHPPLIGTATPASGGRLDAGTYRYQVTTMNSRGESTPRAAGITVVVPSPGSRVTLRWSPIEEATGYRVYRGSGPAETRLLGTAPASASGFVDTGASPATGPPPPASNTARTPGGWHAAYGGRIERVSQSPGYFRDVAPAASPPVERFNWGASATSLAIAGGLVTRADVARGRIDHALSLGLPNLTPDSSIIASSVWAFPAQRSDGKSTRPDAIPEGARLRLDPDLDLDRLNLSPLVRMLAEAAQTYGIIVQGGSAATVIYGEDPSPYERAGGENFYDAAFGPREPGFLSEFPWQHLELLEMRLCSTPGRPCPPAAPG